MPVPPMPASEAEPVDSLEAPGTSASGTASASAARAAGRPRDPAADEAIIEATLELMGESGFEGLRVSDVADRARVSKATMYRRWSSKHDLVLAALRTTPSLDPVDTGSLRRDLKAIFGQFMRVVERSPVASLLAALAAERLRRPGFAQELDPFVEERTRPVQRAIARAVSRGELASGVRAARLGEALGGVVVMRLFFGGPTDDEAIEGLVDDLVDAFAHAHAPPHADADARPRAGP